MEINWPIAGPLLLNLFWCAMFCLQVLENGRLKKRIRELEVLDTFDLT